MASEVGICNMALSHLGEDGIVSAIRPPDGSANAGHCARFYAQARNDVLEMAEWAFAAKRVALASATNDSTAWSYKFAVPSDCVKPRKVWANGATDESKGLDFYREGGFLYCNDAAPTLLYTQLVTDTTKFSSLFTSAVSYKLASYIAGPIVKKPKVVLDLLSIATTMASKAAMSDANASTSEGHDTPANWMTSR